MSAIEKKLVAAAKQALAVIDDVANTGLALSSAGIPSWGGQATSALRVISAITKAVQAGFDRQILPAEVLEKIEEAVNEMRTSIASNDASVDASIDAKFGVTTGTNEQPSVTPKP